MLRPSRDFFVLATFDQVKFTSKVYFWQVDLLSKIYNRFIKGDLNTKVLFLQAFVLSAYVRFLMLFISFNKYAEKMGVRGGSSLEIISAIDLEKAIYITHIVKTTCSYTKWESKCMVQALVSKWILKRRGIDSTIYFGVKKDEEGMLKAHAWLRVGDKILTGIHGHKTFKIVNQYA